jgi:outer membrane protein OmpA-like peptidoglycan-associated protein
MKIKSMRLGGMVIAATLVAGCATQGGQTATGAGVGAALGAGLGALIGDSSKAAAIGAGIGAVAGGITGYNWDRLRGNINDAGGQELGITTTQMPDGSLKVLIPENATFDIGKYDLKPDLYPVLNQVAAEMNSHPQLRIKSVGHTDSTGSVSINQPLSNNRASAVTNYLASQGVAHSHMTVEGRAANDPIASNDTAEGRRMNRRVELFLYAVQ